MPTNQPKKEYANQLTIKEIASQPDGETVHIQELGEARVDMMESGEDAVQGRHQCPGLGPAHVLDSRHYLVEY